MDLVIKSQTVRFKNIYTTVRTDWKNIVKIHIINFWLQLYFDKTQGHFTASILFLGQTLRL